MDLRPAAGEESARRDEFASTSVWYGLRDVQARGAWHECVRPRGWPSCTTRVLGVRAAGLTSSGACASGSTERHSDATRLATGGAATTSTTLVTRAEGCATDLTAACDGRGAVIQHASITNTSVCNGSGATADGNRIPAGQTLETGAAIWRLETAGNHGHAKEEDDYA
jgi:hypothetical protein